MRNLSLALILAFAAQTSWAQQRSSPKKNKSAQAFETVFERSLGQESPTYLEMMDYYRTLSAAYPGVMKLVELGESDANYPLHALMLSLEGDFDRDQWEAKGSLVVLINNGIHPGEPDGIDASMMLVRDAAMGRQKLPANTVLVVIPCFNIGGMLQRSPYHRVDQEGPREFGARGNSQNLDLNRDFMKADAAETRSLIRAIEWVNPLVLIDNHVSNGADYQHVMTLLSTQSEKLGGAMGRLLREELEPEAYRRMKDAGFPMVPYVNHWGTTPEKGWDAYLEGPRYLSGYGAVRNIYSFVPETHMLKPFADRVRATYALNVALIETFAKHREAAAEAVEAQRKAEAAAVRLPVAWTIDTTQVNRVPFLGYQRGTKPSEVSGQPRLFYDRSKPFSMDVAYRDVAVANQWADIPEAYIIPRGWTEAWSRLTAHGISYRELTRDTTLRVEVTYIEGYKASPQPYEGHFTLREIKTRRDTLEVQFLAGDYLVPANQSHRRYLAEALEADAPDGLLGWGFFNAVLQQKEGFSGYAFEDTAAKLLRERPALRAALEAKKASDADFAGDGDAQLNWLFKQTEYYELRHRRYPVYKLF
ncbi:MAG: hypothetical protein K9I86_04025 [Cryomorphaceae bacterium]|nr:hypothetical protein [Cryomorphaceae bacterium]